MEQKVKQNRKGYKNNRCAGLLRRATKELGRVTLRERERNLRHLLTERSRDTYINRVSIHTHTHTTHTHKRFRASVRGLGVRESAGVPWARPDGRYPPRLAQRSTHSPCDPTQHNSAGPAGRHCLCRHGRREFRHIFQVLCVFLKLGVPLSCAERLCTHGSLHSSLAALATPGRTGERSEGNPHETRLAWYRGAVETNQPHAY